MDSDAIEEEAARWVVRRESGSWSDADEFELEAWLKRQTANRIAYVRLNAAWNRAARMRALGAGIASGVIPRRGYWGGAATASVLPQTDHILVKRVGLARASYFAIAVTLIGFAVGIYFLSANLMVGTFYATPVGGVERISLADGSRITLNTDTSVRVALTDNERRIRLERGEAFFEVAKDRNRPFVVYAGDNRVVAVGTKFSVRRDQHDIQVVVTEGQVDLAAAEVPPESPAASDREQRKSLASTAQRSTFLSAGAVARASRADVRVKPNAAAEADRVLSWRYGYVAFDDTALADAVAEFNRYSSRKIFIEDPSIAAVRIGGNFRSDNTEAFLWLLQGGFSIKVEESKDKIILRAR